MPNAELNELGSRIATIKKSTTSIACHICGLLRDRFKAKMSSDNASESDEIFENMEKNLPKVGWLGV